jgi:3-oxoadipate enol-lactonase
LKLYEKVVLPWIFTDEFYYVPGGIEQIINMAVNYPFLLKTHGLYHQSQAILKSDTHNLLNKIHCPTLVLVGQQDILTPVKFNEQLVQEIANAELVVLERDGYGFLIESPDAVAQVMVNFLAKLCHQDAEEWGEGRWGEGLSRSLYSDSTKASTEQGA